MSSVSHSSHISELVLIGIFAFSWLVPSIFAKEDDNRLDFKGGGTDGKGHEVGFSFGGFTDTKLSLSYFNNRVGIDNGDKYQRWMLDVMSTF